MDPLPIDPFVDRIAADVRSHRAAVIVAAPGAGKTTRVPPALAADGPLILLQPRRVAARAIAVRIAAERGWTVGREVGWQIRFERRSSPSTRLLVVTEGILTARLQNDPLLSEFRTIVLDEFHERSIHADLAIALARQAWRARDDLRVAVMSATLDAASVSAFLGGCPIVDVPGRVHPVDVEYRPGVSVADAAADVLAQTSGQVLCFLPGAREIERAAGELGRKASGAEVVALHGTLPSAAQDRALSPSPRRRVILATNIAETSLTVPGVTAVVDSGLHKVSRYDAARGIDSLETERITADAAGQRAGRAGRLAPGVAWRLWDARDRLRPHREAEIHRIDLSATVLDVIAWGGDPRTLEWFERPDQDRIDAAIALLIRLGLVTAAHASPHPPRLPDPPDLPHPPYPPLRLTPVGEQVRHLPLHPRLARMLVEANGDRRVAQACALLSERHLLPPRTASTSSDLLSAIDDWPAMPKHIADLGVRMAEFLNRTVAARQPQSAAGDPRTEIRNVTRNEIRNPQSAIRNDDAFLRSILAGYPDRVAQRREPGSNRVKLASGAGALIGNESGVRDGEFLVAIDVQAAPAQRAPGTGADARIRLASRIEREWLQPTRTEVVHRFDSASGSVKAARVDLYDALVLAERPAAIDPGVAAQLLAEAWMARGPQPGDRLLLARLRFAGHTVDLETVVRSAARGARSLGEIDVWSGLPHGLRQTLDRDAPETIAVPSGRRIPLDYRPDGTVVAPVKLQELFGLGDTPRIGPRHEPVVLSLLAPNGRPVQTTRDLRSFWDRTYPEVRKELRGRYPKHPWPEDPWNAPPTSKTNPRPARG